MEEGEQEQEILDARMVDRRLRLKRAKNLVLPKALKPKRDGVQWRTRHAKDAGTTELDPYHRAKLRAVLSALFQQHLYSEAAGVVSVLLQAGTIADHELNRDTAYYWAAMEVLRQVDSGNSNILRFKRLYRILQRKQVNPKLRGQVQMELALYLMTLGDSASYDAAYNELRPIIDIPPFRDDPAINLCHGYTLHRVWYDRAVQEVEKYLVEDLGARPQHGADREDYEEGGGENDAIMDLQNFGDNENWLGTMVGGQSDDLDFGLSEDMEALDVGGRHLGSQGIQRGLYEDDEEEYEIDDFWTTAVVRWTPDLDRRLFPVRLPQTRTNSLYKVPMDNGRTRDAHVNAIKCFRRAMSLAANMTPALLPLVQLLLAAGDVKGAIKEIDKCCDAPHLLPLSIKALLLESIGTKDKGPLAECYASILHINPSSSHSLKVLIDLHTSGEYKTEALVECIATHLDVEAGQLEVWKKLAACLQYLNQQWDKELARGKLTIMGQTSDIMEGEENLEGASSSKNGYFPIWKENMWGDRKIWWSHKHFHEKSLDIEQQIDGDWRRIGYKAVCSIHILGLGSNYKRAVCKALTTAQEDTLLDLVQAHTRNSVHLDQEI